MPVFQGYQFIKAFAIGIISRFAQLILEYLGSDAVAITRAVGHTV
jgi:hypothetical protein